MASGFFLGGMAEGAMGAQKQALAERTQTQDVGLRSRGLDLQEQQFQRTLNQDASIEADKRIADTMSVVSETIKSGLAGGVPPDKLKQTVMPLIQSVLPIAQRTGRDPNALVAQVDAQLATPSPVARAAVEGRAAGVKTIEQERAIQQQPEATRVEISPWKTPKEKIENEDKLRNNFEQQSKNFVVVRDFYDRMKTAPETGAGDLSLVFSYMKILDPASTVREGEQASAANAAGVPSSIAGTYNRLIGGGRLDSTARKQLREAADQAWGSALQRQSQITTQFTNIAKRNRLDPRNVIIDYTAGSEGPGLSGVTSFGQRWDLKRP